MDGKSLHEEGVKDNDESLRNFLRSTGAAALLLDLDLRVRYYTARFAEMFKPTSTCLNEPLSFLLETVGIEDLFEDLERLVEAKESIQREIQTRDDRWLRVWITVNRTSGNQIAGLIITFTDFTDQVRMEERLQKLEEQFRMTSELLEKQMSLRTAELLRKNIELRRESQKRKNLQKRMFELTAQQQRSLGQQLHDGLAQDLLAAQMLLANVLKRARSGAHIELSQLELLESYLKESEREARSLARGLVPVDLEDARGLPVALDRMAKRISELRDDLNCWLEYDEGLVFNDDFAALKLYYIAREAVNNAFVHADATTIVIRLRAGERGAVVLEVEDDGIGIAENNLDTGPGIGISIMSHRAEIIDAQLEIKRRSDRGTLVRCTVPGPVKQLSSA